jgi:hypothetical protein
LRLWGRSESRLVEIGRWSMEVWKERMILKRALKGVTEKGTYKNDL